MQPDDAIQIDHLKKGDKAIIMLDMSKFDLFQLCQIRYYYRHMLRRGLPIINKARALDDGGLAHEGLEVYFKMLVAGAKFPERIEACKNKIKEMAADPAFSNAEFEDIDRVVYAVEESCDYWRHEDEHLEILAVEAPFAYVLYEDDYVQIIVSGKIDLLVNKHGIGREASYQNLPYDHKTYSRDSELFRLSNQFMNYCSAVKSHYIVINRIGLQKTLKPEEKHKRKILSYDPVILQEWRDNVKDVILDEYLHCVASGKWKQNFTSCSKFNRLCEYYKVCDSSGQDSKDFKLQSVYVEADEWDVTVKFTKGK